ncbi:O-antigen ligase family protein [Microbacterium deminutum]
MLTIYLVLLMGFPSNLTIAVLGAYGRPQFLFGLCLLVWWVISRLQARTFAVRPVFQPVRLAIGAFVVVALLSFAHAMLRGQPFDQISPSISALARLFSGTGVLLVAMDGLRTMQDVVAMTRRIAIGGGLLAALGIVQFFTKSPVIDFLNSLPGFTGFAAGGDARAGFIRSAATATHPLEYATALSAALPLAIATAMSPSVGIAVRGRLRWWLPVALIAMASFLAVSRSALIGFAVAVVAIIPALPRKYRLSLAIGGVAIAGVAVIAVPGLFGTTVGMFTGAADDPSALSRQAGIAIAPVFISASPLLGAGIGTFLPRYYIFDDQWLQLTVDVGILGAVTFAGLFLAGIWSAINAGHQSQREDVRLIGRALAASTVTVAIVFAFFDGFAFPISAGLVFLLIGLCAAIRTVGAADADAAKHKRAVVRPDEDD